MTDSSKTAKKVTPEGKVEEEEDAVNSLFSHWVKKKSDSKSPGRYYYFNTKTKSSVWTLEDLVKEEKLLDKQENEIIRCLQKKNIKKKLENVKKTSNSLSSIQKNVSHRKRPKSPKSILSSSRQSTNHRQSRDASAPNSIDSSSPSHIAGKKRRRSPIPTSVTNDAPPIKESKISVSNEFADGRGNYEPISYFGVCLAPMENNKSEDEEMELMEVDEIGPGILEELRDLRKVENEASDVSFNSFKLPSSENNDDNHSTVVIDTNIFISHLSSIEKILELGHSVHVPWTVFRELDHLKGSTRSERQKDTYEKICYKARRAIDFLHRSLSSENSKIFGQSGEEEQEASLLFRGSCPDDKILQCCLYLKKKRKDAGDESFNLLLYSNDKNLLNKAILNQVPTSNSSSLYQSLKKNFNMIKKPMPSSNYPVPCPRRQPSNSSQTPYDLKKDIIDEAKDLSLQLFTNSLRSELIHLYGSLALKSKLESISPSPLSSWSLSEAFRQVFANWEVIFRPLLGDESDVIKKELGVVESLLARPRPLNKIWSLLEECLRSLNSFNSLLNSSRPTYYSSSGRDVKIRIELLLKRKVGVENDEHVDQALGGNIYECFNSIWNYIYAYVTSYSNSLNVPLSNAIPSPKEVSFEFNEIGTEEISHLNALTNESKKLANKLQEFLQVSDEELSTSSPVLLELMNHMHKFIYYCSSFRPGGHPSADPLPKLVPRSLLQYSTHAETRQRMINGQHQLRDLIHQLEMCCDKF